MRRRELVVAAVALGLGFSAYAGQVTQAQEPEKVPLACQDPAVTGLDPRLPCTVAVDVEVGSRSVTLSWDGSKAEDILGDHFGGYRVWRWRVPRGYDLRDPNDPTTLLPDTGGVYPESNYRGYSLIQVIARRDTNAQYFPFDFEGQGGQWVLEDPDDLFTFEKAGSVYIGPGGVEDSVFFFTTVQREEAGPINGFAYYYAVTYFANIPDPLFPGEEITAGLSSKMPAPKDNEFSFPILTGGPPTDNLEQVLAIPNPYSDYAAWEFFGQKRMQFVNLPDGSTVEIFTAAGDFVRKLTLDAGARNTGDVNAVDWDLRSEAGEEVTAGIYVFRVEAPNGRDSIGRFVVIR